VVKEFLLLTLRLGLREVLDIKEIKTALFQMNPDKAPGLDGFNASFRKTGI